MKLTSILLLLIFSFNSFAQVKIGDNSNTINSNAVLELESTTKGLLIPRMTEAQRLAISFPAQGMLVYQTNNQSGFYYNSGSPITSLWQRLTNDFDQNWIKDGANMVPHPNITGNIGIGTNSPDKAGLVVNKKIGAVNAMFGDNTTGVAIESSFPGIGLNSYYSGSRKYISNGYAGLIGLNPTNGDLSLWVSGASGTAGNTASLTEAVTINPNANVGIGTSDPQAKLHINGSLRLQNGSQGSGKVLTSDASGNATWQTEGSNIPYIEYALTNNNIVSGDGVIKTLNFDAEELKKLFTTVFENGVTKFVVPQNGTYVISTSITLASGGAVSGDCYIRLVVQPASSMNQVLRHSHDFLPGANVRKTTEGFTKLISLSQGDKFWIEVVFTATSDLAIYGGTSSAPKSTLNCYKVAN